MKKVGEREISWEKVEDVKRDRGGGKIERVTKREDLWELLLDVMRVLK